MIGKMYDFVKLSDLGDNRTLGSNVGQWMIGRNLKGEFYDRKKRMIL